jgi:glucosamine kinase
MVMPDGIAKVTKSASVTYRGFMASSIEWVCGLGRRLPRPGIVENGQAHRLRLAAMVVIGIDAGGTKTVCQVADADGHVLAETRGAGANLLSIGEKRVESVLRAVLEPALANLPEGPTAVCLGMAGVDQPRETEAVRAVLARIGRFAHTLVVSDSLIALEAGVPGAPGVVVASGTGSIAYGRDAHGRAARAGGWGYVLADEGSGFWLGKEAIRAVMRAADGRGPATALSTRVLAHFGVEVARDVAREVYQGGVKPAAIATLAAEVEGAAMRGDSVATAILDEAARELALLAASVARELDLAAGPVILAGGTFRAAPGLARTLMAELARRLPRATSRLLDVEPAYGAVRLAIALAQGRLEVPTYR